jgi:hypothetical protein
MNITEQNKVFNSCLQTLTDKIGLLKEFVEKNEEKDIWSDLSEDERVLLFLGINMQVIQLQIQKQISVRMVIDDEAEDRILEGYNEKLTMLNDLYEELAEKNRKHLRQFSYNHSN